MARETIVLGAGIVGLSTAIHLAQQGRSVVLVDRRRPGSETSFGNAGIIQSESVRPFRFPRDVSGLAAIALNQSVAVRYDMATTVRESVSLFKYWRNSAPVRYQRIARDYASLIRNAAREHGALIAASRADAFVDRSGWIRFYVEKAGWNQACKEADCDHRAFGIRHDKLDQAAFDVIEPDAQVRIQGAVHWREGWTVNDLPALMERYLAFFTSLGGRVVTADAAALEELPRDRWSLSTPSERLTAENVVIALGPWSTDLLAKLGYAIPLFVKRGYHTRYAPPPAPKRLRHCIVDAQNGYVLSPMRDGIRLATGAEFAGRDMPPTPLQLDAAERVARHVFPMGERLDPVPWMGSRPCTPDMLPVIGPAPRHRGLWFNLGHGHHGLTLGPISGRLLAEQMSGERTLVDLAPFQPSRLT